MPEYTNQGQYSSLNITAAAQITKTQGRCVRVVVEVSAAAASAVYDTINSVVSAGAANAILNIPASTPAGTVYYIDWPIYNGIYVAPGSGVTLAVTYSTGTN